MFLQCHVFFAFCLGLLYDIKNIKELFAALSISTYFFDLNVWDHYITLTLILPFMQPQRLQLHTDTRYLLPPPADQYALCCRSIRRQAQRGALECVGATNFCLLRSKLTSVRKASKRAVIQILSAGENVLKMECARVCNLPRVPKACFDCFFLGIQSLLDLLEAEIHSCEGFQGGGCSTLLDLAEGCLAGHSISCILRLAKASHLGANFCQRLQAKLRILRLQGIFGVNGHF